MRIVKASRRDEATSDAWLAQQPLFDSTAKKPPPATIAEFIAQRSVYAPDINVAKEVLDVGGASGVHWR